MESDGKKTIERGELTPYIGPRPYSQKPEDRARFFGRSQDVQRIVSLVFAHPVLLVYAQSGAGKTSLFNARIVPELEGKNFEVLSMTRVQGALPKGIEVKDINNFYMFNALSNWEISTDTRSLANKSLAEYLQKLPRTKDEENVPVLRAVIFDQFEEIFTLNPEKSREQQEAFFRQVTEALDQDPLLRVVFVIREEYLARVESFAHLLPQKLRIRYHLERMQEPTALQAIKKPLEKTVRRFDEGVAEKLVKELMKTRSINTLGETVEIEGEYVEPVQLQVVCMTLWNNLPSQVKIITHEHLKKFGNVDHALVDFYEGVISKIVATKQIDEEKLRNWFGDKLITRIGTRGTIYRGEQVTAGIPNKIVEMLEQRYIIRQDQRAGGIWYELTHDRFIEPILTSNKSWREQCEEARKQYEEARKNILTEPAKEWRQDDEHNKHLLRGAQLEKAIQWDKDNPGKLDDLERKFLERSQEVMEKELQEKKRISEELKNARKLRLLSRLLAIVLIIAFILAIYGWLQTYIALGHKNQANRLLYQVYKNNYQQSENSNKHDEAALWLRKAIDLGQRIPGVDIRSDEWALQQKILFFSHLKWATPKAFYPTAVYQARTRSPIWMLTISGELYRAPFTGSKEMVFERVFPKLGSCKNLALSKHHNLLIALFDEKLMGINVDSYETTFFFPRNDPSTKILKDGLYASPDGESVFFIEGNLLIEIKLETEKIQNQWSLPYKASLPVENIVVDQHHKQVVLQAVGKEKNQLLVVDLITGKEVLKLDRQENPLTNALAHGHGRVIFVGFESTGEITVITLGKKPSYWKKKTPWQGCQVTSISNTGFVVSNSDGYLRHWSFDGKLIKRKEIKDVDKINSIFLLPGNSLLVDDTQRISIRPGLDEPPILSTGSYDPVFSIRDFGNSQFIAVTYDDVEIRRMSDNKSLKKITLDAKPMEVAIDIKTNMIYALVPEEDLPKQLARLVRYDPDNLHVQARSDPIVILGSHSFRQLPGGQGIVARLLGGLYRLDAATLVKREKLFHEIPGEFYPEKKGVWMVYINKELERLEVWQYHWDTATLSRPILIPAKLDSLSALHFQAEKRELFWGYNNGAIYACNIPDKIQEIEDDSITTLSPARGEGIVGLWTLGSRDLVAARKGGELQLFKQWKGEYKLTSSFQPFPDKEVIDLIPGEDGSPIIMASNRQLGSVVLTSSTEMISRKIPSTDAHGSDIVCRPGLLAYPQGSKVILETITGHVELTPKKPGVNKFEKVITNVKGSMIAALTDSNAIYHWKLQKGKPITVESNEIPFTPRVREFRFVDEHTLGVLSGTNFFLLDLSDPNQVKFKETIQLSTPDEEKSYDMFTTTGTFLCTAGENHTEVLVQNLKDKSNRSFIQLQEGSRALALGGKKQEYLLVGGVERVWVISLAHQKINHAIKIPSLITRGAYIVRGIKGISDTDFIAIGGQNRIFIARVSEKTIFTSIAVNNYVWRINQDHTGGRLFWQGNSEYGELPLGDFNRPTPTLEELSQWSNKWFEGEEIVQKIPFVMSPVHPTSKEANQ